MTQEIQKLQENEMVVTERDRENGQPRYAFAYVLIIGRKFHSVVNFDCWGTETEMQATKWGVYMGANAHWQRVAVLVYVKCTDGYYRLCASAQHGAGCELLRPFKADSLIYGQHRPEEMPWQEYYAN